jgi:glycogen debranching enzyme
LTPISLTATAFYFYDAKILAQTASLLGYEADAKEFSALAETIRAAFNKEFFHEESQSYSTHSQCANAIPLAMGIVPPEHAEPVFDALVKDVEEKGYITGVTWGILTSS